MSEGVVTIIHTFNRDTPMLSLNVLSIDSASICLISDIETAF
jgi:hypothetical protein